MGNCVGKTKESRSKHLPEIREQLVPHQLYNGDYGSKLNKVESWFETKDIEVQDLR